MTTVANVNRENLTLAEDECGLKILRRQSFPSPNWSSSVDSYSNRDENHESTSSECPSACLTTMPLSTTESSVHLSHHSGDNMFINTSYMCQMPQVNLQPAGTQLYQPLIYDDQRNHFSNTATTVPSFGYGPVQLQPIPIQPLQQQLVYPIQPGQQGSQLWASIPNPNATIPYIMGSVSHPQWHIPTAVQNASSVVSSTVSTPWISSPVYVNAYGYINTPVLSSASSTPIPCTTTHLDVPPSFDLGKNNSQNNSFPERISCNINMGPVATVCKSAPEKPTSVSRACINSEETPPKMSGESVEKIRNSPVEDGENLWQGKLKYKEWKNGGSNLFITWSGSKTELVNKLHSFKLKVRNIFSTSDENILNVIFQTHPTARKAFTMQKQLRVRIVPPKNSRRLWWRNPSPNFLVKFETRCQLVVKMGKAECHDVVGELLKGCLITADQLKGDRLRVLCCEGSFMFPGGKIVKMTGDLNRCQMKTSLGWISCRCEHTKAPLVTRRSWNNLGDYIYQE